MCGRHGFGDPTRLDNLPFGVGFPGLSPRFNITPGQHVPLVINDQGAGAGVMARWGLVPFWAGDPAIGNRLANARSESVREKPAFRSAFKARRGLLMADLFYEWQAVAGSKVKQPWCIRRPDTAPFAFAALWERWRAKDQSEGEVLLTCTIITTTPNAVMRPIHDRMPVILEAGDYEQWLDTATAPDDAARLMQPCADNRVMAYQVSTWVNSPAHDDTRCIEPISAPEALVVNEPPRPSKSKRANPQVDAFE